MLRNLSIKQCNEITDKGKHKAQLKMNVIDDVKIELCVRQKERSKNWV